MASIAEGRGDGAAAMNWKMLTQDQIARDDLAERQATHERDAVNQYVPPPGPILEPASLAPWRNTEAYKDAAAAVSQAQAAFVEGDETTRKALSLAQEKLGVVDETGREDAIEAGDWGIQDQMVMDAQTSLAEKAAIVVEQVG
jgi:hypothetical protein